MRSSTSRSIMHRPVAKDVFYTPAAVAKTHISLLPHSAADLWLDPFRGKGSYYDHFPSENKDWAEIEEDRDFFAYEGKPDIICSNPPYSMIDRVLEASVALQPRIISYLLLHGALTPKRLEFLNAAGYGLTGIYITKVYSWYGMTEAYTFERGKENMAHVTYDRIVHRA